MGFDDIAKFTSQLSRNPKKRLATLRRVRDIVLSKSQQEERRDSSNDAAQWNQFHVYFDRQSDLYREKVISLITTGRAETEDDQAWGKFLCLATGATSLQAICDTHWHRKVIHETSTWLRESPVKNTHRHTAARDTLSILKCAIPPSPDEAIFCGAQEAATLVDSDTVLVVRDQQLFDWKGQPIDSLFRNWLTEWPEHKKIRVTIPDLPTSGPPTRRRTINEVTEKIINGSSADQRWNILDFKNIVPVPYPDFLSSTNCQLLHSFNAISPRLVSKRTVNFLLLSEGGNHTPIHVDSHGLATFITIQQGEVGFGWIANATKQDRLDIHKDALSDSLKRKARYIILRSGQTVFMPSGTIHFIFRRRYIPTLATGGHILTWKTIPRWLRVMKMQKLSQEAVDADVTKESTQAYINVLKESLRRGMDVGCIDTSAKMDVQQIIKVCWRSSIMRLTNNRLEMG
jgi:hypothetical protein